MFAGDNVVAGVGGIESRADVSAAALADAFSGAPVVANAVPSAGEDGDGSPAESAVAIAVAYAFLPAGGLVGSAA